MTPVDPDMKHEILIGSGSGMLISWLIFESLLKKPLNTPVTMGKTIIRIRTQVIFS